MNEQIETYSVETTGEGLDHDMLCVAQAERLLETGYLEYELTAYATAVYQNGSVKYYLSQNELAIDQLIEKLYRDNLCPIPIQYFVKRFDLVNTTKEELQQKFYLEIFKTLHEQYDLYFFQIVHALTQNVPNNYGYELLTHILAQLENCFDENHLQLFQNLLNMMLQSHYVSLESAKLLELALEKEYKKMETEPISSGKYSRTFAGFAYRTNDTSNEIKFFIDAVPHLALEKQIRFITLGYTVTPILQKTYYSASHQEMGEKRTLFRQELQLYFGENYINIMQYIKSLPSSVNSTDYHNALSIIKEHSHPKAINAFQYFGHLWNVL